MPTHTVTIPNWLPERLNVLLRVGQSKPPRERWAILGRKQKEADALVAAYARQAGVPPAATRRRVTLAFANRRTPADGDGRLKQILDALVHAGLLVDDSPKWCEVAPVVSLKGDKSTTIIMEDLDE